MKSLTRHSQKSPRSTSGSRWQLQTAKARFSEVFRRARSEGPQYVTKAGKEAVVIIPAEEFEKLTERRHQPKNLVDFFRNSPLVGAAVDLAREPDHGREFALCAGPRRLPPSHLTPQAPPTTRPPRHPPRPHTLLLSTH